MNGAECLLATLAAHGVRTCFMNPGTSEMQFVAALDRTPAVRGILGLHEGVCAGAADGYARMARHPAAALLHLGPGLANALSNLHNARKAFSPVVNIVGEHTTGHARWDAPLAADIEAFARPVSGWVHTVKRAEEIGADAARAIRAAYGPPGQVATLIVPADFSWSEAGEAAKPAPMPAPPPADAGLVRELARLIRAGEAVGLLLGREAALERGVQAAARVGVPVFVNRYAARVERGRGMFAPPRLAYFPEHAEPMLAGLRHLMLVESKPPVSFFGYPDSGGPLAPAGCVMHPAALADLEALAEEIGAAPQITHPQPPPVTDEVSAIGAAIARALPEAAIVSDEMVSSGEPVLRQLALAHRHSLLPVTGGSIGQGLPVALGAAVACPERKVVALEADGSAMYTPQALWTMARERLDVTTVIFANRRYRILDVEMKRTGAHGFGPKADAMLDIGHPNLDWVKLAEAQGVEAWRVTDAKTFDERFRAAMRQRGPNLIEAVIP